MTDCKVLELAGSRPNNPRRRSNVPDKRSGQERVEQQVHDCPYLSGIVSVTVPTALDAIQYLSLMYRSTPF